MTLTESIPTEFDRLPPHSLDAERCVLASMMLDREAISEAVQIIDRDDFFQADHQVIWGVLVKLYETGAAIDAVILRNALADLNLLEEVGGLAYIGKILEAVPSSAHAVHYATIVREKGMLRRLISASNATIRDAYAPMEYPQIVMDRAENRILSLAQQRLTREAKSFEETLHETFMAMEDRTQRGIETGFFDLDDMLNGLHGDELIIVAGRPSMGKTQFALDCITGICSERMIPCGMFSLEMSRQQLSQRMLCSRAGVDSHKVRRGMLSGEEFKKLAEAVGKLSRMPFYVDDSSALTILELRAKARRMKAKHDVKFIAVDYMQLMDARTQESRQQQITEISRGMKSIARELHIPVMALSQLNRQSETREGHRPRMSDLRESGAIEQDADVILLLHREDYYRMSQENPELDNISEVIVAKQRNGPTGVVKLFFDGRCTRFANLSSQHDSF